MGRYLVLQSAGLPGLQIGTMVACFQNGGDVAVAEGEGVMVDEVL